VQDDDWDTSGDSVTLAVADGDSDSDIVMDSDLLAVSDIVDDSDKLRDADEDQLIVDVSEREGDLD
jgi:hypothetical protein